MDARELMIGNYYKWYADGKYYYFQVDNAFFMDINVINNSEPIELTEEILLKFKDVLKKDSKIFTSKYTLPLKRNKCLVITDIGTPNFMMGIAEIDFENKCKVEDLVNIWNWDYEKNIMLHEFQNLFYSLTNQELNVQL